MECYTIVLLGRRPPNVNLDAIPREITVKAGKKVALDIPYTGWNILCQNVGDFEMVD